MPEPILDPEDEDGRLRLWISGAGGFGKTTKATEIIRQLDAGSNGEKVPLVISDEWSGSVETVLAEKLKIRGRKPSDNMVRLMSRWCELFVDGVSERSSTSIADDLGSFLDNCDPGSIVVTSRDELPQRLRSKGFACMQMGPVPPEKVRTFAKSHNTELEEDSILKLESFQGKAHFAASISDTVLDFTDPVPPTPSTFTTWTEAMMPEGM